MKTTKPIATISYNTTAFLKGVLTSLEKQDIISFWCFIRHEPEEDETKPHFHVYIEPAKAVETTWLRKQFIEPVAGESLPRGVMPIGKSKFVDWYWYGLHDRAYLASKGQSRKFAYHPSEMISSMPDYFDELVRTNPNPKSEIMRVIDLIQEGYSNMQIAMKMNVAVRNLGYFISNAEALRESIGRTVRGDGETHEDTGVFDDEDN